MGTPTKDRVDSLAMAVLMFIESVIILDAAITQVASERFNGQPILFRDCAVKLGEQLQLAERLSEHFNSLARELGIAEINLEDLRSSLPIGDGPPGFYLHQSCPYSSTRYVRHRRTDARGYGSVCPSFRTEIRRGP